MLVTIDFTKLSERLDKCFKNLVTEATLRLLPRNLGFD